VKIYTKTGDKGQTSLYGGRRILKDDIRIEAYGTIDELNSFIGQLLVDIPTSIGQNELLTAIQNRLFTIGANLASDPQKELPIPDLKEDDIDLLEMAMDNMDESLEPLRSFILPGGSSANASAHICRTVARRAERRMVSLSESEEVAPILIKYVNRLSDYFFVLGRRIASELGHEETPWVPRK